MAGEKTFNRWLVVVGALLIQISLGAIYIYSVFKPGLKETFPNWTDTDLALPSQLVLAFFALSTIIAGRVQDKIGPRTVATVGGILLGIGLFIASRATSLGMFVAGFSIIGGIGIGTAYVCPIATCVKWFPDKRGLITGLAVAGFGAGGLVFTPVAKSFIASYGPMTTFVLLGIIFFIAVVIGAQLMINPPAGYVPAGWTPPAASAGGAGAAAEFGPGQMLATPQFWLLWITYFAGCTAGLMIIMNTTNIWQSCSMLTLVGLYTAMPLPKDICTDIFAKGASAVMLVSVLNAGGRIGWGKISDTIGRKTALLLMFIICGVVMLLLNLLTSYTLYLVGVAIIGFCFGGFLAIYPAVTTDYFGTKNVGINYGMMFTAYGAGGLFGPWLAPKLMEVVQKIHYEAADKSGNVILKIYNAGNYKLSFVIAGIMCLASLLLVWVLKPPKAK